MLEWLFWISLKTSLCAVSFMWIIMFIFALIIGQHNDYLKTFCLRMFLGIWFLAFILCTIAIPIMMVVIL